MKFFLIFFSLLFFQNCSFDNKSGIWQNEEKKIAEKNDLFKDFKTLDHSKNKAFSEIIEIKDNLVFSSIPSTQAKDWTEIFYSKENIFENFKFNGNYKMNFQSGKLSKYRLNEKLLFVKKSLITSDIKGNLISYSLKEKRILNKYNFYQKKFKNTDIKLNYIAENDIVYVSDNLGFLYAYNHETNSINWAKKFNVPFRSNLKLFDDKLVGADQNNNLLIMDKKDGNILKSFPTEEQLYINRYENNIVIGENNLFFLNTFGTLYSIEMTKLRINWFLNLHNSINADLGKLFGSKNLKFINKKLVIPTNTDLFIIDSDTGTSLMRLPFKSKVNPISYGDHIFFVNDNNLLVCINLKTNKIIYSISLKKIISNVLKKDDHNTNIKSIRFINNNLNFFLNDMEIIIFDKKAQFKALKKLSKKPKSEIIFLNDKLYYLDKKKTLVVLN